MSEHPTMQEQIVARAMKDDTFRQQLLSNPRQTLERELGITLPPNVTVLVHEETANTLQLVLPSKAQAGGLLELSDAELEQTTGGIGYGRATTNSAGGCLANESMAGL